VGRAVVVAEEAAVAGIPARAGKDEWVEVSIIPDAGRVMVLTPSGGPVGQHD
jgi:hypothetical protein